MLCDLWGYLQRGPFHLPALVSWATTEAVFRLWNCEAKNGHMWALGPIVPTEPSFPFIHNKVPGLVTKLSGLSHGLYPPADITKGPVNALCNRTVTQQAFPQSLPFKVIRDQSLSFKLWDNLLYSKKVGKTMEIGFRYLPRNDITLGPSLSEVETFLDRG